MKNLPLKIGITDYTCFQIRLLEFWSYFLNIICQTVSLHKAPVEQAHINSYRYHQALNYLFKFYFTCNDSANDTWIIATPWCTYIGFFSIQSLNFKIGNFKFLMFGRVPENPQTTEVLRETWKIRKKSELKRSKRGEPLIIWDKVENIEMQISTLHVSLPLIILSKHFTQR